MTSYWEVIIAGLTVVYAGDMEHEAQRVFRRFKKAYANRRGAETLEMRRNGGVVARVSSDLSGVY